MGSTSLRNIAIAVFAASFALASQAFASPTFSTIYTFCAVSCSTSANNPSSTFVMDSSGNLYGTAPGGAYNKGQVYELSPNGTSTWTYTPIHDFCHLASCLDGGDPTAALIIDSSGNLYGVTQDMGANGAGTVFKISHPNGSGGPGFKLLYTFCPSSGCADGKYPMTGLSYAGASSGPYNGTSPLFGTTDAGGTGGPMGAGGLGVVFELTPPVGTGSWTETVLYNMCSAAGCVDGREPASAVLVDASGNLYGVAGGGAFGAGSVYQLAPSGGGYAESVVYNFCSNPGTAPQCLDGKTPNASLILDSTGNKFYGTTTVGGANYNTFYSDGAGLVFELDRGTTCTAGTVTEWCETVLYNFCSLSNCADGFWPATGAGLAVDSSGFLYGELQRGGVNYPTTDGGVVYKLTGGHFANEHVWYSFCSVTSCADGVDPNGGVIIDASGNLYGVTPVGGNRMGAGSDGTAFTIAP